jgi:hypothetical protein
MKCLLFLFSGLLIACSNPALAQNGCTPTGTGPVSAIANVAANAVSSISSKINSIFSNLPTSLGSSVSSLLSMLLVPLQGMLTMLGSSISSALAAVQSTIANVAGAANSLTSTALTSAINELQVVENLVTMLVSQMSAVVNLIPIFGPMVAPEISLVLNTGAVLVLSVASVAVALLNATFGLGVGLTASLAINAIGLVTPLVTQGIQAVNQLLNTIPVTASMIPQALLPAIAGTVSTLETVVSGAVTNLICMSSSALSGVATAAQGALQQIMGELPSLTNALSGVLSTAGSSMTSGPITALQTALNSFQQMQANMTQMGK